MYKDTVTLFNKYHSKLGDMWFPTVLEGVDLITDRASIVAVYGADTADNASLHVKYGNGDKVSNKQYLPPKAWEKQTNDLLGDTLTFKSADFIYRGVWDSGVVNDDDYISSFFDHMKTQYDDVYAITTVAKYDCIPHFEIMCK